MLESKRHFVDSSGGLNECFFRSMALMHKKPFFFYKREFRVTTNLNFVYTFIYNDRETRAIKTHKPIKEEQKWNRIK